jgi:hypothetical protein
MRAGKKKKQPPTTDAGDYSPERRDLGWLLAFADVTADKIRALSARKQKEWRKKVYEFPRGMVVGPGGGADPITPELINELAVSVRAILDCWRREQPYFLYANTLGGLRWMLAGDTVKLMGDLSSMFKLQAVQLLALQGKWLRRCASPSCASPSYAHLFVARKTGAYCSQRCAAREVMRRYRALQRERAAQGGESLEGAALSPLGEKNTER